MLLHECCHVYNFRTASDYRLFSHSKEMLSSHEQLYQKCGLVWAGEYLYYGLVLFHQKEYSISQ